MDWGTKDSILCEKGSKWNEEKLNNLRSNELQHYSNLRVMCLGEKLD